MVCQGLAGRGSHGEVGSGVEGQRWSRHRKPGFGSLGEARLAHGGVARVMAGKAWLVWSRNVMASSGWNGQEM